VEASAIVPDDTAEREQEDAGTNPDGSPRKGWWQRTFGA
jgi:ribonuclease E